MIAMISMHPSIMYGDFRENKLNSFQMIVVLYCIVLGVALTRPLYSTGGVIVRSVLKVVIISL